MISFDKGIFNGNELPPFQVLARSAFRCRFLKMASQIFLAIGSAEVESFSCMRFDRRADDPIERVRGKIGPPSFWIAKDQIRHFEGAEIDLSRSLNLFDQGGFFKIALCIAQI